MGKFLFTLLILGFWTVGSAYHYVCNMKEVCTARPIQSPIEIVNPEVVPVVEAPSIQLSSQEPKVWATQFESGSSRKMTDTTVNAIASEMVELASQYPNGTIKIRGHADHLGLSKLNSKLSLRRAQTVRSILVAQGVPHSKIEVSSHSDTKPTADQLSPEGRALNRRVEIEFSPHE